MRALAQDIVQKCDLTLVSNCALQLSSTQVYGANYKVILKGTPRTREFPEDGLHVLTFKKLFCFN